MATDASEEDLGSEALFVKVRDGLGADVGDAPAPALRAIKGGRAASRRSWTMGLAVALAAAAVLAFMLPRHAHAPGPKHAVGTKQGVATVGAPPHGSEVEKVDFGDNTGTVFAVEGAAGPVAVVWIDDQQGVQ